MLESSLSLCSISRLSTHGCPLGLGLVLQGSHRHLVLAGRRLTAHRRRWV